MALVEVVRAQESEILKDLDETRLINLLNAASNMAEKICGRRFKKDEYVETFNGDRESPLFLEVTPIVELTSIVVKDSYGDSLTYEPENFRFDPKIGEVQWAPESEECGYFKEGFQNVIVTYTGGMEPIDDHLQSAVVAIAECMRQVEDGIGDLKFEKLGEYAVSYNEDKRLGLAGLPGRVIGMLRPFIRRAL